MIHKYRRKRGETARIRQDGLVMMFRVEAAVSKFWENLSEAEKQAYLKAHPHSKYGKGVGKAQLKQAVRAPKDLSGASVAVRSRKEFHSNAIESHLDENDFHHKKSYSSENSPGQSEAHKKARAAHQAAIATHSRAWLSAHKPNYKKYADAAKSKTEAARKASRAAEG